MDSGSGYIFTGGNVPSEDAGKKQEEGRIPKYIFDQLRSRNEAIVVIGMGYLVNGEYPREQVCEILAGIVRKGVGGRVADEASVRLVQVLGKANPLSTSKIVRENLFAVNDVNGSVLSRIIAEPVISGEIRKAAIDLLSHYREGDIGKDTMQKIEDILTLAVSNEKDDPRMRKTIAVAFSMRPSRPRISSAPPLAPWNVRKTMQQMPAAEVIAGTRKPVKA